MLLQLALGKWDEALVIAVLLVLNAVVSFIQESRADRALALLRQRLSVTARVRRGEATGEITATGARTYFGKTAELVRTAKTESHLARLILRIIRPLIALDVALVLALFVYAVVTGLPLHELLPFALILLVASVPVALPATFTLATAFGARELASRGVLVTRLSAIEEAAAMEVLASDKTGTLTQNRLAVSALQPYAPHSEDELLRLAALACDEATQVPDRSRRPRGGG